MFEQRLTKNAKNILGILTEVAPPGSYLAGGTALALWLNHRNSYDLDIYSPIEFNLDEIRQKFDSEIPDFQLISTSWQTLHGKSKDTEISLFYYQYNLLKATTKFLSFAVSSIEDIAAMKLEAIAGRGLKRDFFDVYRIAKDEGWSLAYMIELNDKKYDRHGSFTPHILRSLVYFDDAENLPERAVEVEKEWKEVKQFFIREISLLSENRLQSL